MTTAARQTSHRAARRAPEPTFAAGSVRGLLAAFERLGHDVPSLLRSAGLPPADLEDPDARRI